ncbi:MAG TPA: Rid family detoxifying hydrolase, partial [Acidiferrobacteraceae bacterium]|nr:Rid family detoxifying hydrolase [Acidiferrobacteraceae bacterium]
YLSGQIPLHPASMNLVEGDIRTQTEQVWTNLMAVAQAAGASSDDLVKLTVYLTDLADFAIINDVLAKRLRPPYPARAVVGVQALPRGAAVEIEAIAVLPG